MAKTQINPKNVSKVVGLKEVENKKTAKSNIVSYKDAKSGNKNGISINGKDNPNERMNKFSKDKKQVDLFDEMLDAPQKSAVYLAGQGYKKPSEALGIKNKYGKIAADLVLDPTNALFFLKGAKLAKSAKEASKPRIISGLNMTHPRDAARIINTSNKYKKTGTTLDTQSAYSDLNKKK